MHLVYGIGATKLAEYGPAMLAEIDRVAAERNLARDVPLPVVKAVSEPSPPKMTAIAAAPLFREGLSIEAVAGKLNRAKSTVVEYLCDYIQHEKPASIDAWVAPATYRQVCDAAKTCGRERLKPIFIALGERVPYDQIRVALKFLECGGSTPL
jgi:ATP-dependent DNA helicase RecQ